MENNKIPTHLGIILDGNRRWAEEKGLPVFEGHKRGGQIVQKTIKWCKERGIKILTLYVFSTENWKRPKREINFLMKLGKNALKKDFKEASKEGIKVKFIGEEEKFRELPGDLLKSMKEIEKITANNNKMLVNFALSYGGRAEIVQAIKNIIAKKIPAEDIDENTIKESLWTSDVDLVIRTGKEQRISNFLIWQTAYSELYFSPKYWPDFTKKDLDEALLDYASRQRRFGI